MKVLFTFSMLVLITATAAGSVGDALNVSVVGRNADGPSTSVALSAGLVFHGRGSVVEVLDRATLVRLGQVELPGVVQDIAYRDNLVFVAAGYAGLRIVSVSDPARPVEVGHLDGLGLPYALALHGDLVLMVYAGDGLAVIDAADPAAPQLVATAPIVGLAIDVAAYGDRAIVARGAEGLEFFDISNPAQPVSVLVEPTVGSATSLQVAGDLLFSAEPNAGLSAYDLSVPGVEHLSTLALSPSPLLIAIAGDVVLAADGYGGFHLVDVGDPDAMLPVSQTSAGDSYLSPAFDGRFAYLASRTEGLRVFDALNPAVPVDVATIPTPGPAGPVDVEGDLAAFASSAVGLRLVDVSDLADPIDLATWRSDGNVSDVDLGGTLAYVSENTLGLGVIDVSDPAAPTEIGRFTAGGATVRSFAVEGPLGYLATNNAPCLRILDLGNPAQPVEIGSLNEQAIPTQVAVAGERAFLTVGENGLLVADIGNPQAPFVAQRLVTGGNATLVAVAGDLAFVIATVTDGLDVDSRLVIYNTSGDRVTYVSDLLLEEWVWSLTANLPYVYLGGDGVLKVIDVSVPPIPAEVGHFQFAVTPAGLFVRDRDVVVGDDDAGIWVVHNTHAEVAVELSGLAARREPAGVRLSWETTTALGIASYTVWRDASGGSRVAVTSVAARDPFAYSVLDGLAPASACTYWVEGVLAAGGSIWLGPATAAATTGSVAPLRCWPNPVRSAATFGFALPAAATVQLEVFDLRGRRVARLQSGEFAAGSHQAAWNRCDDGGRPVAAGTYLARLSGEDFVRTAKVVVGD